MKTTTRKNSFTESQLTKKKTNCKKKQKCTLQYLFWFFLESLNMVILKKGKKGKNQNEKNSSHQYVHFDKIVFNGNHFSLKSFLKFIMIIGYHFVTTAPNTRYCFKLLTLYSTMIILSCFKFLRLYLNNHFTKITFKKLILFGHI